jgi:PST family polysaccharide transporter
VNTYFDDHEAQQGLGRDSARTGALSMVTRGINSVFQFAAALWLARLLSPEDYGLVGMVLAIAGFAPLVVDLGSREAIVQRSRITASEVAALFWRRRLPLSPRSRSSPRLFPASIKRSCDAR